ncbi:hypothetical protein [Wenxinia saemankumensis]|uniref:Transferrin-binding protein B C-lobe/N-lobe beta barrel domain-containing protein n=1 Tax=Wenxinia saemankumensis TaxID=1447782 RepID=A0A1M6AVF3_9RHOB|nr:hypothetical protein [Wenxinia saemankumensis]SHI40474.1 hypothetical protein SAMN05444417_0646 [Wenxinia saemankumensis]
MNSLVCRTTLMLALAALTACGGIEGMAGGGVGDGEFGRAQGRLYDLDVAARQLAPTDPSALPAAGTATYEGAAGFSTVEDIRSNHFNDDISVYSDLRVDVGFDDGSVTGRLDNFVYGDPDEEVYESGSGGIAITNGTLADGALDGDVTGTVAFESGDAQLDLDMAGFFRGADAGTAELQFDGTAIMGGETEQVYGFGIAER